MYTCHTFYCNLLRINHNFEIFKTLNFLSYSHFYAFRVNYFLIFLSFSTYLSLPTIFSNFGPPPFSVNFSPSLLGQYFPLFRSVLLFLLLHPPVPSLISHHTFSLPMHSCLSKRRASLLSSSYSQF